MNRKELRRIVAETGHAAPANDGGMGEKRPFDDHGSAARAYCTMNDAGMGWWR